MSSFEKSIDRNEARPVNVYLSFDELVILMDILHKEDELSWKLYHKGKCGRIIASFTIYLQDNLTNKEINQFHKDLGLEIDDDYILDEEDRG